MKKLILTLWVLGVLREISGSGLHSSQSSNFAKNRIRSSDFVKNEDLTPIVPQA